MLTRLILTDFLAHGHSELELGPGLTVLCGPNNTGKSAVVEALRCLAENPPPRHVIRHGAKEARVTAEFSDGHIVSWVRRPAYATYELTRPGETEPEVFAKFGRTPPEEILDVLRLDSVALEKNECVDVHLGDQREPVFLLNRQGAGSTMAEFFAASSESAHLIAMQNLLTNQVREAKREQSRLQGRQAETRGRLDRLAGLPAALLALDAAREAGAAAETSRRELPALEKLLADGRNLRDQRDRLTARDGVLATLATPPELWPTRPLAAELERRAELVRLLEQARRCLTTLAHLAAPPALEPVRELASLAVELTRLRRDLARATQRRATLAELNAPPITQPVAELTATRRELVALRRELAAARRRSAALNELAPPPVLPPAHDLVDLARTMADLIRVRQQAAELRRRAEQQGQDLETLREHVAEALEQAGVCPLCNQRLDAAAFLHGHDGHEEHSHDA